CTWNARRESNPRHARTRTAPGAAGICWWDHQWFSPKLPAGKCFGENHIDGGAPHIIAAGAIPEHRVELHEAMFDLLEEPPGFVQVVLQQPGNKPELVLQDTQQTLRCLACPLTRNDGCETEEAVVFGGVV